MKSAPRRRRPVMIGEREPLSRRGTVLVCVLLCLGIIMSLILTLARSARLTREQVRREAMGYQIDWLVLSGYERVLARLAVDDTYVGETWELDSSELHGRGAAKIELQLVQAEDGSRQVQVSAEFPAGTVHSVRRTQSFFVP